MLAGEGINIVFTAIALAWMDGAVFTLILLGVLALILAVPAFIVVKLRERNGAYDFSDIMGPEEHAAWKKMRQKRRSR